MGKGREESLGGLYDLDFTYRNVLIYNKNTHKQN